MVDSSSTTALIAGGNSKITAGAIQVVGKVSVTGSVTLSPAPQTGVAAAADPMASLAAPTGGTNQGSVTLSGTATQTINPGIYTKIIVGDSAKLTLNPGVYVLKGGDFKITGSGSVTGSGVLIYMAGTKYPNGGGSFGGITVGGTLDISPVSTGTYAGVVIFQARDNTQTITLKDTSTSNLHNGLLYAPKALLSMEAKSQLQHAPVVVDKVQMIKTSSLTDQTTAAPVQTGASLRTVAPLAGVLTGQETSTRTATAGTNGAARRVSSPAGTTVIAAATAPVLAISMASMSTAPQAVVQATDAVFADQSLLAPLVEDAWRVKKRLP
jgi:hypothetical protein